MMGRIAVMWCLFAVALTGLVGWIAPVLAIFAVLLLDVVVGRGARRRWWRV